MTTKIIGGVAVIESREAIIKDAASAIDLMMTVKYETGCDKIALNKEALIPEFFILSRQIAGEVLEKLIPLSGLDGNLRRFSRIYQWAAQRFHL